MFLYIVQLLSYQVNKYKRDGIISALQIIVLYNDKYILADAKNRLEGLIFDLYVRLYFIEILLGAALKISAIFADSDIDEVCTHRAQMLSHF